MKEVFAERRSTLCRKLDLDKASYALITKLTHIFYFTGLYIVPYKRFIGLVLSLESRKGYLIIPELEKGLPGPKDIELIAYRDEEDPFLELLNIIKDTRALWVEKNEISLLAIEKIMKLKLKLEDILDLGNVVEEMKMIKNAAEIDALGTASRYADEILVQVKKVIKAGSVEKLIKFELLKNIAEQKGAQGEAFAIQVSSGPNSSRPHGVTGDRQFKMGDAVIIDFGVNYAYYKSDMTRTFFIGRPGRQMEEIYHVVLEAQKKAIEAVAPGRSIREVDLAARETIGARGYGQFFIHRTGHGLGIDIHEAPPICDSNVNTIQEGMVFTVEPDIYIPEVGGVRIEDLVLVTSDGGKVLTQFPKELADVILT